MTKPGCHRLVDVEAARDGRLLGAERTSFDVHFGDCLVCRREHERLDSLGSALRDATVRIDELRSARLRRRIVDAVARDAAGDPRPTSRPRVALAFAGAAACVALFGIGTNTSVLHGPTQLVEARAVGVAHFSRAERSNREVVALDDGTVEFRVRPEAPPRRLLVRVPDGTIEDLGTRFRVRVAGGHTESIEVFEGIVAFARDGAPTIELHAGETYRRIAIRDVVATGASDDGPTTATGSTPDESRATISHRSSAQTDPRRTGVAHERREVALADGTLPAAEAADDDEAAEDSAYLRVLGAYGRDDRSATVRAADEYLRRHPNGFRRVEVIRLRADAASGPIVTTP